MKSKSKKDAISGQSMVMMVVMLSTAALGAAALASFLIISGFRNIANAGQSMDAIFAADAGIECVLFKEFGHADYSTVSPSVCPPYIDASDMSDPGWKNGNFNFVFNRSQSSPDTDDWSSFGKDLSGTAKRVLNIRFNKKSS